MAEPDASSSGGAAPSGEPKAPNTQAPTGTLVLMVLFLAATAGLWILVYRLLLER